MKEEFSKEEIAQILLDEYNSWENCTDKTVLSNVHEVLYDLEERFNLIDTLGFGTPELLKEIN